MSVTRRLDAFQQRHRWAGFPIAVVYKFGEDQGAVPRRADHVLRLPVAVPAAAAAGLGARVRAEGDPDLQHRILDSTLSQFPVIGESSATRRACRAASARWSSAGSSRSTARSGVAQAMQNAMNVAWAVPRNHRPNPIRAAAAQPAADRDRRARRAGDDDPVGARRQRRRIRRRPQRCRARVLVDRSSRSSSTPPCSSGRSASAPPPGVPSATWSPARSPRPIIWQLLQLFGTAYVGNVVKGAGATYGVFALVLGLLAWIFLAAVGVVLERRDQRRADQAPLPAVADDPVHRQRRPDRTPTGGSTPTPRTPSGSRGSSRSRCATTTTASTPRRAVGDEQRRETPSPTPRTTMRPSATEDLIRRW